MIWGWDSDEPKKKRKAIPKHNKNLVWKKYIGANKAVGKCFAGCGTTIHFMSFEVGHNRARSAGGSDNIENLRPICGDCNKAMGNRMSIEAYKAKYFGKSKGTTGMKAKTVIALDKVKTYLSKQGYDMSSKKYGFDAIGVEESAWDKDRHVVVGLNNDRKVTGEYVLRFKKKVSRYYEMIADRYMFGPHVDGLIAYTGELSKDAPVVAKGSKPTIKFKKF
jgi:5-methylcytosine-specific restriction endonuclease McrA